MGDAGLSFVELEARIRALPEGPVAALNTPKWLYAFNAVGIAGIVIGLLPSLSRTANVDGADGAVRGLGRLSRLRSRNPAQSLGD